MQITLKGEIDPTASAKDILSTILRERGYQTEVEQASFCNPPTLNLDYLYQQSGITQETLVTAQSLLDSHLALGHDICIFGDYDADGVTATAVLYRALVKYCEIKSRSSRLLPFIPDRHRHGYGLSEKAVKEVLSGEAFTGSAYPDFKPKLIITVDTGIVAHQGVSLMREAGYDIIITDHHQPEAKLPDANYVIHTLVTSGAGVSWIFASHLLEGTDHFLDLATIGIVADMMPLIGFNRTLVTHGLKKLTLTDNPGLHALKLQMGIPSRASTTYDISFGIAPRINAAGRIYSPLDALRLLCTNDQKVATSLASTIESHNTDRQVLTDEALTHALEHVTSHKLIALSGPYHEGVIGLVAGKLVEKTAKPAIVISINGDVCKGSARSIPGFSITSFLRSLKTPFLGLGGHDQAAGFSVSHAELDNLLTELNSRGDELIDDSLLIRHETADLSLVLSQATLELAKLLHTLEPYGLGNPKPKFLFKDLRVVEDRSLGTEGKHHKLIVEQNGVVSEILMFNTRHSHPLTYVKNCIANLDTNVWKNKESSQLVATYVEN